MEAQSPALVRYALLQSTLAPPDVDALRRAFESVRTLTAADAPGLARDAYGILVKNLSAEDATVLHRALEGQGIQTEIVPEKLLPTLPASKFIRELEFAQDALLVADPLGRKIPLEYRHLLLLAVGEWDVTEFRRETRPSVGGSPGFGSASRLSLELALESPQETRSRSVRTRRHFMELILGRGAARFTLEVDRNAHLLFRVLGNRAGGDLRENLATLLREFHTASPQTLFNRGAYALRQAPPVTHVYPSRNAFHEEILWMLWQTAKQEAR